MISKHPLSSVVVLTGPDRSDPLPGDFAYLVWDNNCHGVIIEVSDGCATVLWSRSPDEVVPIVTNTGGDFVIKGNQCWDFGSGGIIDTKVSK